jgi:hypothetical protein
MALTIRRWVAALVLACAAIAVWQIPSRFGRRRADVAARIHTGGYGWPDASTRLGMANLRLRVLELRDSALNTAHTSGVHSPFTVLTAESLPESTRRTITAALTQGWARYDAGTRYPVVVAVIRDTTRENEGLPMANSQWVEAYTFPPDSVTPVCRVLIRATYRQQSGLRRPAEQVITQTLEQQSTQRSFLGPCALYTTFGMPGSGIAQWLSETDWSEAQDLDWSRPSPIWKDNFGWAVFTEGGFAAEFLNFSSSAWRARDFLSDGAIACLAGRTDQCPNGLEWGLYTGKDDQPWYARVVDARAINSYRWRLWGRGAGFGPAQSWLISDMVRDLGRDRFAAFWASPAGPDSAFARAAGVPLAAWIGHWAQRAYGPDVLGPWIPARTWLAGLVVVLAGLVVAAALARERQVA